MSRLAVRSRGSATASIFINRSRNIILHMYDDRGLDVIAPQIEDLRPVYEAHKTWVLDHDRGSINNLFADTE